MVTIHLFKLFFIFLSSSNMPINVQTSPPKVTNVQIFQYNPIVSDRSIRNALIIWNEIESATQYIIRVLNNSTGTDIDLSQPVLDTRASYSVLQREQTRGSSISEISPKLPLVIGTTYGVEITARNNEGDGPTSNRVNFTLSATGMSYPMQVLSLEPEVMMYYGHRTTINQLLRIGTNSGPIVVDAIHRRAYWYNRIWNNVATQSLSIGGVYKALFDIPADQTLESLTYDWIAKVLYITYVSRQSGNLTLCKRQIYNIDIEEKVFPEPLLAVSEGAIINSEINPLNGYIYYSITHRGSTIMYVLNLRILENARLSPVRIAIDVTSALALNPLNNNLLVCDKQTGDILQCSYNFSECNKYIIRSVLEANSGNHQSGLPAGIIKYGGQFIYWTSVGHHLPGIFAVNVSDTSTMMVLSYNAMPNYLAPLSPDQQPTPVVRCLSSNIFQLQGTELLRLNFKTSHTLQLIWRNNPTITSVCGLNSFSLAPFIFKLNVAIASRRIFSTTTRKRIYLVQGLETNTRYEVFISAYNEYSLTYGGTGILAQSTFLTGTAEVTCDIESRTFHLHHGDEEHLLHLSYSNGDLLRSAAKSGECINITVEHETQTALVQDRVRVFLSCNLLKQNMDTVIEWFREPLHEFNGNIRGRPERVINSKQLFVDNDVLIIPETQLNDDNRSNRFTCRAITNGRVHSRLTTVFVVGGPPLLPETGGCMELNESTKCILGKQLTNLTLYSKLKSVSLKCPIINSERTDSNLASHFTWTKDGIDIIRNGRFTNELNRIYPEFSESTVPVMLSEFNRITLLVKPNYVSSVLYFTQCLHYKFTASLEDTYYHLTTGEWTCSVRNSYGEDHAHISITEPNLCTSQDRCGSFTCHTVSKLTCCNCPRDSNHVSLPFGKQCTRIPCPILTPGNGQNVNVSINQNGVIIGTYTCQKGYTLVGMPNRICQKSLQSWTGSIPICNHVSKNTKHLKVIFIFAVFVLES